MTFGSSPYLSIEHYDNRGIIEDIFIKHNRFLYMTA